MMQLQEVHHLNHLLTKKLYEDESNYEIIDLEEMK